MKKVIFMLLILILVPIYSQAVQTDWANGDGGAAIRAAIQGNDTELYTWMLTLDTESELKALYNLEDSDIVALITGQLGATHDTSAELDALYEGKLINSAGLAAALSDETGTGAAVLANTPTLITPEIGVATGTSLTLSGALAASGGISSPSATPTDAFEDSDSLDADTKIAEIAANATTTTAGEVISDIAIRYKDGTNASGALSDAALIDGSDNQFEFLINTTLQAGDIEAAELASTAVTPGSYTAANITVDQQGRITAAANGSAATDITTSDIEAATLITSAELETTATDAQLPTWKAVKDYLDSIIISGVSILNFVVPATDETWSDTLTYTILEGTAYDADGIDTIEWKLESGGTYAATGVTGTTEWAVSSITLQEGANEIYVRLTDNDTNTKEINTTVNADVTDPVGVADADGTHSGTGDSITSGIDWTETNLDASTVTCTVVNATPTNPTVVCIGNACDTETLTPDDNSSTVTATWAADDLSGNSATGTRLVQSRTYLDPNAALTYWDMSDMTLDTYDATDGNTVLGDSGLLVTTTGYDSGPGIEVTADIATAGDRPRFNATDGNAINAASIDIRFWYKETDSATNVSTLFRYSTGTELFMRRSTLDSTITVYYGGTAINFTGVANIFDGNGHWVRLVLNATTDSHAIYVEDTEAALTTGTAQDTDTTAITAPALAAGQLYIGIAADGTAPCEGIISEFSIR